LKSSSRLYALNSSRVAIYSLIYVQRDNNKTDHHHQPQPFHHPFVATGAFADTTTSSLALLASFVGLGEVAPDGAFGAEESD